MLQIYLRAQHMVQPVRFKHFFGATPAEFQLPQLGSLNLESPAYSPGVEDRQASRPSNPRQGQTPIGVGYGGTSSSVPSTSGPGVASNFSTRNLLPPEPPAAPDPRVLKDIEHDDTLIIMEHAKYSDLSEVIRKLSTRNQNFTNHMLWSMWQCCMSDLGCSADSGLGADEKMQCISASWGYGTPRFTNR